MSRRGENLNCKVHIGDLARDANEQDLEKAFSYYGPLRSVWVARNPPGFAFVEFEDDRDADDAIRGLDGSHIAGGRVRVELSTGKIRPKPWARRGGGDRGGGGGGARGGRMDDEKCYECGERGHYARDCSRRGGGGSRRGGGARSRSRSRSRDRYRRDRSRDRSKSRSKSRDRSRDKSRSRSRRESRSKSRD